MKPFKLLINDRLNYWHKNIIMNNNLPQWSFTAVCILCESTIFRTSIYHNDCVCVVKKKYIHTNELLWINELSGIFMSLFFHWIKQLCVGRGRHPWIICLCILPGPIPTLGVARLLSSTWQCNIGGSGGHGCWPCVLLLRRHSASATRRPENIENTKVPVSTFISL